MIVVVDSGVANTGSILNMLTRVGARAMASSDPNVIETAERLILPGWEPLIRECGVLKNEDWLKC